ncbi:TOMM precursor leader peptide-binding protein [Trinickia diaoshuihuensis]|uniref:TOMM precursor leader peptide-binding protein n=1 Tax=Trinickia diaoshuihuensis TaxID=2292265 RepID=UPI000E27A3D0|nr:TOMM precursor leader peptide-binding protein [Trinickia diaoshuihuensis]
MLDDLSRKVRFKPHLLLLDDGPDTLYIVDEFKRSVLNGAIFPALAACLRDARSIGQIVAALSPRFSDWEILRALDHFLERGYLRADEPDGRDPARGYYERSGLDGDRANAAVQSLSVHVEAYGVDPLPQIEALRACGIELADGSPLVIALCDSYTHPELPIAAERAAARGARLLLVNPTGVQACIGPLLGTGGDADAPCIACVRYWIGLNRPVQSLLARRHGERAARMPVVYSAASLRTMAAFVATFLERLAVDPKKRARAGNHVLSVRTDSFETAWHRLIKRPQCPYCGNPSLMREQAFEPRALSPAPTVARRLGGYRIADAQTAFERYRHFVSPLTGAIAYSHPMPGRHAGSRYVYVAGYVVCPRSPGRSANRFDRICSGKGATETQARASALCEALERFSGVYQGDEATVRGSLRQLTASSSPAGEPIDPNALQQFSERQFDAREVINAATDDVRKRVPQRFSADAVIDWTPAWSIAGGGKRLVPLSYCFSETPDAHADANVCVHNPNGSAAGSCFEEAVLQGLLELVERDAVAIWWYNQLERPGVDIASFHDPYFDALCREYESMGWRLWAIDITHDLRIPTFAALACDAGNERFSIGFGCHLDPSIALQRALTEVNQLLDVDAKAPPPWDRDKLSSDRFLYPAADAAWTDATTWPALGGIDLREDVELCVARFAALSMDALVVNKTRPDIGLDVVQTIVPGLCHFWPRFGARRLYEVPVKQGWLARPREETELNRALLFL